MAVRVAAAREVPAFTPGSVANPGSGPAAAAWGSHLCELMKDGGGAYMPYAIASELNLCCTDRS